MIYVLRLMPNHVPHSTEMYKRTIIIYIQELDKTKIYHILMVMKPYTCDKLFRQNISVRVNVNYKKTIGTKEQCLNGSVCSLKLWADIWLEYN